MTQHRQISQQQDNQSRQVYQSVETTDGVVFSKGNMMVNGVAQVPLEAQ